MSPFLVREGFFGRETLGRVDLLWDGAARVDSGSYFTPRGDAGLCLVREDVQHTLIPTKCYLYCDGLYHDSQIPQSFHLVSTAPDRQQYGHVWEACFRALVVYSICPSFPSKHDSE